ncbi:hypothetical protein BLGI_2640 [Brevibacillus laterosporus GI-9]|nr:hypothetical protein BLGI_2640 [Brevibacillus laterosporus GI-9]
MFLVRLDNCSISKSKKLARILVPVLAFLLVWKLNSSTRY